MKFLIFTSKIIHPQTGLFKYQLSIINKATKLSSTYIQVLSYNIRAMKRPVRTYVIDEDEHLQNLRKIIKRDFFGTTTAKEESESIKMTLNGYISNYKSNQNQFFSQMVHLNDEEWKEKHWWIDKQDKMLMLTNSQKFKALPYHNMLEDNVQINGIDTTIVKQDAKNSFFFNRQKNFGSLQPTEYEEAKKVLYANCKFNDPVSRMRQQIIKAQEVTPMRSDAEHSHKPLKGKNKQDQSQAQLEQDDGHLMTWGQIQSTPMRIAGPQFRIPDTPQRDQILHNLNSKINKEKLQNPKKSQYVLKILGSLTPGLNSSRKRLVSSMRRVDSVRREQNRQKNDLEGLLNIKK